ncbi:hypothetical protein IC744_10655 [Microbacterium hominis]|uniref:hypothetical protein n=1 Tax=Microbacterium TaxID=33882 RepID=UPI00168ADBAC|nr:MULTISPECIES: hypothetical protein [Microbacterium]QOC26747.1 hypothetical protein IC745_04925 [Microbacterium hominis]QOC27924.1 hypothetical protein IC744_10655 [Microbacterium hominis]QYF96925.1 hypothetical protein KY498_12220 [Microbacterium sp. PAMC21962]
MRSDSRAPFSQRLLRGFLSAIGYVLTLLGVIALVVAAAAPSFGGALRAGIVAATILAAFGPVAVAVAYLLVRARNRRLESHIGASPLSERALTTQTVLGSLSRIWPAGAHGADLESAVLGDEFRIAESTVRALAPDVLLAFLWVARPAQPSDFATSPEFAGLPVPVQDAIILLDLRRDVELRGVDVALTAGSGFYHHDRAKTMAAVRRTANAALARELESPQPRAEALLAALDEPSTWERLLHG